MMNTEWYNTKLYPLFNIEINHLHKYQGVKEFHMLARIGSL